MKLFYFQSPVGYFGDDLTPSLWPKVLPVHDLNCKAIAAQANVILIAPRLPIAKVINQILSVGRIATKTIHGAIAADSFGKTWKRVDLFSTKKEGRNISDYKWADWGSLFDLETSANAATPLPHLGRTKLSRLVKRPAIWLKLREAAAVIKQQSRSQGFRCSSQQKRNQRIDELQTKLDSFNDLLKEGKKP